MSLSTREREQFCTVDRAVWERVKADRADLIAALRECVTAITETPRGEMDAAQWSALAAQCSAAIAKAEAA